MVLSNVTNNINQIAKATNTSGVIYKNEIESTLNLAIYYITKSEKIDEKNLGIFI